MAIGYRLSKTQCKGRRMEPKRIRGVGVRWGLTGLEFERGTHSSFISTGSEIIT